MFSDGALGELLTGYYGIPYAEIPQILDQLALGNGSNLFRFQNDLLRSSAFLTEELKRLAEVQGDVPANAQQLALTDAANRLSNL